MLESVSSTNDRLRRLASEGAHEGTVVLADHQSSGRGRMGRSWSSPAGLGVYFSVLLRPREAEGEPTRWSLAAALAACEACRELTGRAVEIKWPNDLLCGGKKLGGVLAEARTQAGARTELTLGIGINVLQSTADFTGELAESATSLRLVAAGDPPERELVAAACLHELAGLAALMRRGEWSSVVRRFERWSPGTHGRRVRVETFHAEDGARAYRGVTDGVAPDGALRIRREDGGIDTVRMAASVTDDRPERDRR